MSGNGAGRSAGGVDRDQVGEGELTQEQLLYRENILDHYRNPRNRRRVPDATASARGKNPLCGDEIEMFLVVEHGKIADAAFEGKGCAISQASASMLTRKLKGMEAAHALGLGQESMTGMLRIPIGVVRMKCAMLALRTAQDAIRKAGMPVADGAGKQEDDQ